MPRRPHPADVLARSTRPLGAAELIAICGRHALRAAVRSGQVVRVHRGMYALPGFPDPRRAATALNGYVSHLSAARLWGLDVLAADARSHVTLPAHRKHRRAIAGTAMHWIDLAPDEVVDGLTSPLRTVLDCARVLEFPEALAVADSALRLRWLTTAELRAAGTAARGAGSGRVRRVSDAADRRSASAMESVQRAILLEAGLTSFVPQVVIRDADFVVRVDFADEARQIVIEDDSYDHHGSRAALVRDCRRYDELTVRGWLVLRFAWEHVMYERSWLRSVVEAAVQHRDRPTRRTGRTRGISRRRAA